MSVKRQATTELNHENWDQEDPEENKEMGSFKAAPKEILEKRVIKTAKRRTLAPADEGKKTQGLFSSLGGFNKTPTSFDFLANLTKDSKNSVSSSNTESSGLFSNKLLNNSSSPLGSAPINTPLGTSTSQTPTLFSSATSTVTFSSVFTTTKAGPTVSDSPFKVQPTFSTVNTTGSNAFKTSDASPQVTSTIFGVPSTTSSKSLFSTTNNSSSIFQTKSTSNTNTTTTPATDLQPDTKIAQGTEKKEEPNGKKLKYYSKLKSLNESVSEWIKKHVDETPLCILTPIFKDYEAHLKEIQTEYHGTSVEESKPEPKNSTNMTNPTAEVKKPVEKSNGIFSEFTKQASSGSSIFKIDATNPFNQTSSSTPLSSSSSNLFGDKSKSFSFGLNTSTSTTNSIPTNSSGFSFGTFSSKSNHDQQSNTLSFGMKSSPSLNTSPLKFGTQSFTTTSANNQESGNQENQEDEDAPPKVEFTPITEENSVYDKRCKVFVKKDGNFADKGVGTLYIKKIDTSDKYQLLVRANTALGNVLLNLRLSSSIPTQRMGKNNVMIICIPTPESKPPPTSVLIRVKTSEEADELLETLNKYKA